MNQKFKYISIKLDILKTNKNYYFLIDTGSDISLVQKDCIRGDIKCNPCIKLSIRGISDHNIETLAEIDAKIKFSNSEIFEHKFHIINSKLNCSGI